MPRDRDRTNCNLDAVSLERKPMSNDVPTPFSSTFGEPLVERVAMPGVDFGFGFDPPTGRIGIVVRGAMSVVELSPEQMLALGTIMTVQARVDGASESAALQMIAPRYRAALEALLDRRLVKPIASTADEVAGHA